MMSFYIKKDPKKSKIGSDIPSKSGQKGMVKNYGKKIIKKPGTPGTKSK